MANFNPVPHVKDFYTTKVKKRLELVRGWARNGLSNHQIADNLGISPNTLGRFIKEHEELAETIDDGRYHAEIHIENALFKKATGFKCTEVTRERKPVRDEDGKIIPGEYELQITKKTLKQIAPDTNAAQYWLEHRAPKRWERNPLPGLDPELINQKIVTIADLINNPVEVREIGSEQDEDE